MPKLDFRCDACGHTFERQIPLVDYANGPPSCPECSASMVRRVFLGAPWVRGHSIAHEREPIARAGGQPSYGLGAGIVVQGARGRVVNSRVIGPGANCGFPGAAGIAMIGRDNSIEGGSVSGMAVGAHFRDGSGTISKTSFDGNGTAVRLSNAELASIDVEIK